MNDKTPPTDPVSLATRMLDMLRGTMRQPVAAAADATPPPDERARGPRTYDLLVALGSALERLRASEAEIAELRAELGGLHARVQRLERWQNP